MSYLVWLVPVALGMGLAGLAAFLWTMRAGQYDDLDGAAERILLQNGQDSPLQDPALGNERAPSGVAEAPEQQRRRP